MLFGNTKLFGNTELFGNTMDSKQFKPLKVVSAVSLEREDDTEWGGMQTLVPIEQAGLELHVRRALKRALLLTKAKLARKIKRGEHRKAVGNLKPRLNRRI